MGSMRSLAYSGLKPCSVLTGQLSMMWASLAAPVLDTAPMSEEGKGRSGKGEREQLELIGTKDNKMDEEGVSEGQGLILDLVRLRIEQSGEDSTWCEYKELSPSRKETMELRNWRVHHVTDFKS